MKTFLQRNLLILAVLFAYTIIIFHPFIFFGKLPIPADTIVGLYHPWRDFYSQDYPNGIPFKNFQITDSVRQQYPWRFQVAQQVKQFELPKWNPYSFSGTPLLANFQTATFYPPNILYLIFNDFSGIWGVQVILQTVLGGIFIYLYLCSLKLRKEAAVLGTLTWIGSGFFVAWLEWNTVVHVAIYLPLILLSIDKLLAKNNNLTKNLFWKGIFVFSLISSFFAGYLQPFFYIALLSFIYLLTRILQTKSYKKTLTFLVLYLLFAIIILPQLLPTLDFINLSAREIDQANWLKPDWFLPWQNLVQIIAPDFFGNPATLNYFGIWNYQEFVEYVPIAATIFAFFALIVRRDKKTLFWGGILIFSLLFALPTPLAKIPFELKIPFLSTAQPSRIIMISDFALAVLAAFGLDYFMRIKDRRTYLPILIATVILLALVSLLFFARNAQLLVSIRNLYLPLALTLTSLILLIAGKIRPTANQFIVLLILILTIFDIYRFTSKFEPFTDKKFLYPKTKIISFLQKKATNQFFRVLALDDRILPPNFNVMYKLQTASGYDPLYLKRFGEFVVAMERGKPDTTPPWGFNRIITPKNYRSNLFELLNVRYLLTFDSISLPEYKLVLKEGKTNLYEKTNPNHRVYFVSKTINVSIKDQALKQMFTPGFSTKDMAVVEDTNYLGIHNYWAGSARIMTYSPNSIEIETYTEGPGFLVLLDAFYPSWKATIDSVPTEIYITNYAFRGIKVPQGKHDVRFFIK